MGNESTKTGVGPAQEVTWETYVDTICTSLSSCIKDEFLELADYMGIKWVDLYEIKDKEINPDNRILHIMEAFSQKQTKQGIKIALLRSAMESLGRRDMMQELPRIIEKGEAGDIEKVTRSLRKLRSGWLYLVWYLNLNLEDTENAWRNNPKVTVKGNILRVFKQWLMAGQTDPDEKIRQLACCFNRYPNLGDSCFHVIPNRKLHIMEDPVSYEPGELVWNVNGKRHIVKITTGGKIFKREWLSVSQEDSANYIFTDVEHVMSDVIKLVPSDDHHHELRHVTIEVCIPCKILDAQPDTDYETVLYKKIQGQKGWEVHSCTFETETGHCKVKFEGFTKTKTLVVIKRLKMTSTEVNLPGAKLSYTGTNDVTMQMPQDCFNVNAQTVELQVESLMRHKLKLAEFAKNYSLSPMLYCYCSSRTVRPIVFTVPMISVEAWEAPANQSESFHVVECRQDGKWTTRRIVKLGYTDTTISFSMDMEAGRSKILAIQPIKGFVFDTDVENKATEIDDIIHKYEAYIIAKQHARNPRSLCICCCNSDNLQSSIKKMEAAGFTHKTEFDKVSQKFSLRDKQEVVCHFESGNIRFCGGDVRKWMTFSREVDVARVMSRIDIIDDSKAFWGRCQFSAVEKTNNRNLCELMISLPKTVKVSTRTLLFWEDTRIIEQNIKLANLRYDVDKAMEAIKSSPSVHEEWKDIASHLEVPDSKIFELSMLKSSADSIQQVVEAWLAEKGTSATVEDLISALRKVGDEKAVCLVKDVLDGKEYAQEIKGDDTAPGSSLGRRSQRSETPAPERDGGSGSLRHTPSEPIIAPGLPGETSQFSVRPQTARKPRKQSASVQKNNQGAKENKADDNKELKS